MEYSLIEVIRPQLRPLPVLATDVAPVLTPLFGVKAVLFSVHGTLLISDSGGVGTSASAERQTIAAEQALQAAGIQSTVSGAAVVDCLQATIESARQRSSDAGVTFPEVEIRDIWRAVTSILGLVPPATHDEGRTDWRERLAVEYEVRANPVWPMPGAIECVRICQAAHHTLGIVSNSQFFTPLMWRAATGLSFEQTGFDPLMQYFSFVHGRAKPGLALYQLAASALQQRGILASQTLYVGSDLRNDIAPAAAVGFRTALFAGDQRRQRSQPDDSGLSGPQPDVTLTELKQLLSVLRL